MRENEYLNAANDMTPYERATIFVSQIGFYWPTSRLETLRVKLVDAITQLCHACTNAKLVRRRAAEAASQALVVERDDALRQVGLLQVELARLRTISVTVDGEWRS